VIIPIQACISGYTGKPCALFSGYDTESRILSIQVDTDFRKDRREGCVLITNQGDIERDVLFTQEELSEAIECFFAMTSGISNDGKSQRLVFADKVARARPSTIEKGELNESGQKYRIDETISNLQIAALATCWYADSKAEVINAAVDYTRQMNKLWQASTGCIITL
jgi:hypothetical protein